MSSKREQRAYRALKVHEELVLKQVHCALHGHSWSVRYKRLSTKSRWVNRCRRCGVVVKVKAGGSFVEGRGLPKEIQEAFARAAQAIEWAKVEKEKVIKEAECRLYGHRWARDKWLRCARCGAWPVWGDYPLAVEEL